MLRASLYRRVVAITLGAAALVALGVGFFAEVYFRSSLDTERTRIFQDIQSRMDLLDAFLKTTQVAMLDSGDKALHSLAAEYPEGARLAACTEDQLKALARSHGVGEVYLIDGDNRVVATSFAADKGLDLSGFNSRFTAFLNNVRGRNQVYDQHLTVSTQTGTINTYQYYSPSGSSYIFEVSNRLDDYFPEVDGGMAYKDFIRLLFGPILPSADKTLVTFDIISYSGQGSWSIINPGVRRNIDRALIYDAYKYGETSLRRGSKDYYYHPLEWETKGAGFGDRTVAEIVLDLSSLDRFNVATIVTALISCALAGLFSLAACKRFFDRSFVSRIESLHDAISRVAAGERGVAFDSKGEDELSVIGKSVEAMVEDVKKAEEGLRNAKAAETMGLMAGGLAHDINNLLAGAVGAASLLRARLDDEGSVPPDEIRASLSLIEHTGERGEVLVRDLLALSRKDKPAPRRVNLSLLLKETLQIVQASTPPSVKVELHLPEADGFVLGSAEDLGRVILNLCRNGIQAMTDMMPPERRRGGVLAVGLRASTPEPGKDPRWEITIVDQGVGMGPEVLSKLFAPFFSTKSRRAGSGLGLAASKAIAESHGGLIAVASVEGSGSTFTLVLPASPPLS